MVTSWQQLNHRENFQLRGPRLKIDEGEIDHKVSTNYLRTRSTRMLTILGDDQKESLVLYSSFDKEVVVM